MLEKEKNSNSGIYPKVSIIIINWNGWKDTIECLESLYNINYPLFDVIIVDNNSTDGSIDKISEYINGSTFTSKSIEKTVPTKVKLESISYSRKTEKFNNEETIKSNSKQKLYMIKNNGNYGFAEANNIGLRYSIDNLNSKYALLLNNDTVVSKDFLEKLVDVAESNDKIGIVGPMIYYYDYKNKIQSSGSKILWNKGIADTLRVNEIDNGQYSDIKEVDSLMGCAMLIKVNLFEKIGFFIDDYFAYWEETEWCTRVKKSNYKIINVPQAKIWHKKGASSNTVSGFYEYHFTRNMFWFMKSHAKKNQYFTFLLYFFGYRFWFTSCIHLLYHRNFKAFQSFIKGINDGLSKTI